MDLSDSQELFITSVKSDFELIPILLHCLCKKLKVKKEVMNIRNKTKTKHKDEVLHRLFHLYV